MLELLVDSDEVEPIADVIQRRVVVVVERTGREWRRLVEHVLHACAEGGAAKDPLPHLRTIARAPSRDGLAVLGVGIVYFLTLRRHELIAREHVERRIFAHVADPRIAERVRSGIHVIGIIADVVQLAAQEEVSELPLRLEISLVLLYGTAPGVNAVLAAKLPVKSIFGVNSEGVTVNLKKWL